MTANEKKKKNFSNVLNYYALKLLLTSYFCFKFQKKISVASKHDMFFNPS